MSDSTNRGKFWMVLVQGSSSTSHKHYEEGSAREEAERLTRQTGDDVFILEATEFCRFTAHPIVWKETRNYRCCR